MAQLKFGYTVGLDQDDNVVFEFINSPGMIELLGLHAFASKKIEEPFKELESQKMSKQTAELILKTILQAIGTKQ